ncbi:hypothetical protein F5Y18DRAFT_410712 [Xylariaceae sp. FL1019]|nr:hypothetical protein F5Y18DRAFT_410712 [Xylariaceae sp. FL1019]
MHAKLVMSFLHTLKAAGVDTMTQTCDSDLFPPDNSCSLESWHTPVHYACTLTGLRKNITAWFLKDTNDVNRVSQTGRTLLMQLCAAGLRSDDQLVEFLDRRPFINAQDNQGCTALHLLCVANLDPDLLGRSTRTRLEAVKCLLSYGADPTIRDIKGKMAHQTIPKHSRALNADLFQYLAMEVNKRNNKSNRRKNSSQNDKRGPRKGKWTKKKA